MLKNIIATMLMILCVIWMLAGANALVGGCMQPLFVDMATVVMDSLAFVGPMSFLVTVLVVFLAPVWVVSVVLFFME